MKIRNYQDSDRTALRQLVTYLQDYQRNLEPDLLAKGDDIADAVVNSLLEENEKNEGTIMVAEENGKAVGFVAGHIQASETELELSEKKYFYISDLAVLPEFHNKGIGKMLLKSIEDYVKEINIKITEICVLVKNSTVLELYKKMGFREYEMTLLKEF